MNVCLYSCLSYWACKLHLFCAVLYCRLWGLWLHHIFTHYLTNGTTFGGKKLLHLKFVLFLYNFFFWTIFHSKNSVRYCHHCSYVFQERACCSCQILMKTWIFRQIFERSFNIKFNENLSSGNRVSHVGGWTDRLDDYLVAFCNFANAPKKNSNSTYADNF